MGALADGTAGSDGAPASGGERHGRGASASNDHHQRDHPRHDRIRSDHGDRRRRHEQHGVARHLHAADGLGTGGPEAPAAKGIAPTKRPHQERGETGQHRQGGHAGPTGSHHQPGGEDQLGDRHRRRQRSRPRQALAQERAPGALPAAQLRPPAMPITSASASASE